MDASRTLIAKNNKGAVVIITAIFLMVVVAAILLIAVDFSFMYVNKAKLQNAADAGALAGAGKLKTHTFASYSIPVARDEARLLALANFNSLNVDTNLSNAAEGDVVVGTWNPDATPKFTALPLSAYSSANAVKVVARRTGETGTGIGTSTTFPLTFGTLFGNIFNFTNTSNMGTKATAVAWRPPRARTFFMIGQGVCNSPTPVNLSPGEGNLAWTSLLTPSTNANDIQNNFFCPAEKLPFTEVCGANIYTSGGVISSVFKSVEVDFYDPNYDKDMKTFSGPNQTGDVTSWKVIVPVSAENDPTTQPVPHQVWGYAEIIITKVCGTGGGNACPGRDFNAPAGVCSGGENIIVISSRECHSCADRRFLMGAKPVLAQ